MDTQTGRLKGDRRVSFKSEDEKADDGDKNKSQTLRDNGRSQLDHNLRPNPSQDSRGTGSTPGPIPQHRRPKDSPDARSTGAEPKTTTLFTRDVNPGRTANGSTHTAAQSDANRTSTGLGQSPINSDESISTSAGLQPGKKGRSIDSVDSTNASELPPEGVRGWRSPENGVICKDPLASIRSLL